MPSDFLIVFDCDGVLVDSERLMQDIDLQMISDLGWPWGGRSHVRRS